MHTHHYIILHPGDILGYRLWYAALTRAAEQGCNSVHTYEPEPTLEEKAKHISTFIQGKLGKIPDNKVGIIVLEANYGKVGGLFSFATIVNTIIADLKTLGVVSPEDLKAIEFRITSGNDHSQQFDDQREQLSDLIDKNKVSFHLKGSPISSYASPMATRQGSVLPVSGSQSLESKSVGANGAGGTLEGKERAKIIDAKTFIGPYDPYEFNLVDSPIRPATPVSTIQQEEVEVKPSRGCFHAIFACCKPKKKRKHAKVAPA